MKPFNLEGWLKNKNKKIITKNGRPVRIICTDIISHYPIVAAIKNEVGNEIIQEYDSNGVCYSNPELNLFFEELSQNFIDEYQFNTICGHLELRKEFFKKEGNHEELDRWQGMLDWLRSKKDLIIQKDRQNKEEISEFEIGLLDFADDWESVEVDGEKMDAVIHKHLQILLNLARKELEKNLPKWKKDDNHLSSLIYQLDNRGDGNIFLCKKGYAISLEELLNLPYES
jgi:hypothetical protein